MQTFTSSQMLRGMVYCSACPPPNEGKGGDNLPWRFWQMYWVRRLLPHRPHPSLQRLLDELRQDGPGRGP